VGVSCLHRRK